MLRDANLLETAEEAISRIQRLFNDAYRPKFPRLNSNQELLYAVSKIVETSRESSVHVVFDALG